MKLEWMKCAGRWALAIVLFSIAMVALSGLVSWLWDGAITFNQANAGVLTLILAVVIVRFASDMYDAAGQA